MVAARSAFGLTLAKLVRTRSCCAWSIVLSDPGGRYQRLRHWRRESYSSGALNVAADRAVAQQVVGQDARRHRFADRHAADADAGVVAAVRLDLDLVAVGVDRAHRLQDRAGRLDREARHDVLAARDAAEDAAGVVRQELDLAVLHAHLVAVLLAGQRDRAETGADLDPLDGVDRHHRAREIAVELVVDRLAEPSGDAARHHLDHGARRRTRFADGVEIVGPARRHGAVGAPERVVLDRRPVPRGAVDCVRPDLHQRAADRDAGAEDFPRDRAGRYPRGGLARRGAAAA